MSDAWGVNVYDVANRQIAVFDGGVTTGEAYGVTQCHDTIRDKCVLILPTEGVVGVMVSAWPTAVTAKTGEFHSLDEAYPFAERHPEYADAFGVARGVAKALGFEVA
jgi:hypothetical protein